MIDEMGLVRVDGLVVAAVLARIAVCAPTVTSRPSFWVAVGGLAVAAGFRQ